MLSWWGVVAAAMGAAWECQMYVVDLASAAASATAAAAVQRGRGTVGVMRDLCSPWLLAATKAMVTHTRIAPGIFYGMELWRTSQPSTAID